MVLIGKLSCQIKDVKQVAQIYSKIDKLPPYIKKSGPYFQVSKKEGLRALTLYRAEEGKFDQAYDYIVERLKTFAGVASVSYSVERWENIQDTLAILREMGPPE